jgi:aerobic-type carbon monoxide dehydrogenase small subunit (CoxS/CutS family)
MMRGYLDTGNQNPSTIAIASLPSSTTGYDIYVYVDGDNESSTVTGTYTISGSGITTTSIQTTDPGNINFNGTFIQASNSSGNYIKFSAIHATSFTLTATPTTASFGGLRAPVNGIQIIPTPQQSTTARVVSINFVGNGTAMGGSETAGVVAKTNWNNATGNTSGSVALKDETGAANGATLSYSGDNPWAVPITDTAGNFRMIRGYLDTGNQNPSTVAIAGLPSSSTGYDIYVYVDGDNESSTVTGTYTISGAGITTTSIKATDAGNTNFSGTFTQASNSAGNYIKFSAIHATSFTLTATPTTASNGVLRAPVNGIQIVPSPQTAIARAVSISFVGAGTSMGTSESAGVVAKTNWNNAPGNTSSSLALVDETGVANGSSVSYSGDSTWALPITDTAGNLRMMRGYLDNGSGNPSTITISGLPVSSTGYDIYVYADGDNASGTVTRTYTLSGAAITTTSITAIDPPNTNFGGAFTQASNSNGNYVKFTGIQATVFTITATPTSASNAGLRAPVNGLQIIPH